MKVLLKKLVEAAQGIMKAAIHRLLKKQVLTGKTALTEKTAPTGKINSSGSLVNSSGCQASSVLREQAIYQAKPFSKEEEALFAGTLKRGCGRQIKRAE